MITYGAYEGEGTSSLGMTVIESPAVMRELLGAEYPLLAQCKLCGALFPCTGPEMVIRCSLIHLTGHYFSDNKIPALVTKRFRAPRGGAGEAKVFRYLGVPDV